MKPRISALPRRRLDAGALVRAMATRVRAASHVGRRSGGEEGFILLESMVALSLITVLMAALGTFTLNVVSGTHELRARQGATQLANSTMATIGALPATDLVTKHDSDSVDKQFADAKKYYSTTIAPWLATMAPAYDITPNLPAGSGASATISTNPQPQTLNGIAYSVSTYLGYCVLPKAITPTGSTTPTPTNCVISGTGTQELRAVVAVTWSGGGCHGASCTYVTATLVNASADPVFNVNRAVPPTKPVVVAPGDQVSTQGGQDSLQLAVVTGTGLAPLTWQVTSGVLPTGLTLTAAGLVSGTPTALVDKTPLTVTVTDAFGRTATATFAWSVLAPPTITTPPAQATILGKSVNLAVASTCPNNPCAYVLTGAPAGLSIDATTGVITGTPTALGTSAAVTVTVTDADRVTVKTAAFSWLVYSPVTIGAIGNVLTTVGIATNAALPYTCPSAACTITLANSVPGLGLSTTNGRTGTNPTTSLTVSSPSGTVYVSGTVAASAVAATTAGSSKGYVVTATISDSATTASSSGTWTATVTTLVNYAIGRTATQSSTSGATNTAGGTGVPGLAVDGNTNGDFYAGSVTHTNGAVQPWWQVDLGATTAVRTVVLFNRTDCCADRLANGQVFLSNSDMTGKTYDQLMADPAVSKLPFDTLSTASLALSANDVRARFVRVVLSGTNPLHMAEVQVLGANLAAGKTATQVNTGFGGLPARALDGNTDGVYSNNSVTHTLNAQPWWQVDLGVSSTISAVTVWNRTDCCGDRLNGAVLLVSSTDMTGRTYAQLSADSSVTKISLGATPGTITTVAAGGVAGRYVRVQQPGTVGNEVVSLAEVQVNGTLP